MNHKRVVYIICTVLVAVYIIVMIPLTNRAERNDTFDALKIKINDPDSTGFVKESDVVAILSPKYAVLDTMRRKDINTLEIEQLLNSNNRVEKASCHILNNGTLLIDIDPIKPVARIFDNEGSVYVNAAGKRIASNPSYLVDVPVVTVNGIADTEMISHFLPLLTAIKSDPKYDALVSSLHIDSRGDIIIIPNVVGHVINFGDETRIQNKFARLQVFYRDVMPVRGWTAYDTISVKWDGRIVATKNDKTQPSAIDMTNLDEIFEEVIDIENDMTDDSSLQVEDTTTQEQEN